MQILLLTEALRNRVQHGSILMIVAINKAKGALHEQKLLNGNKISTDKSLSLKFI